MNIASALLVAGLAMYALPVASATPAPVVNISPTGAGELTVSMEDSVIVGSVPQGASRVHLLTLDLAASCEADVTVSEITVRHIGLGAASDIEGIYLMNDMRRLTRSTRFERSGAVATLRLRSFVVKKCGAQRVQLLADFSREANVAAEHGVEIRKSSDIVSSAKQVVLGAPNQAMKIATSPTNAGIISVKFLSTPAKFLRFGRVETVARIQLTADAQSDHLLRRITLTNDESARDMDLLNLSLETTSGKRLTNQAARMKAKEVTLSFEPTFVLQRSQTLVFLLKAEIHGSATKKVRFILEEASDLDASPYRSRN